MGVARQIQLASEHEREPSEQNRNSKMSKRFTMVYWKGEKFWLGKLLEHPEIMTQGETLEELEENIKDAYRMMVMEDVPDDYQTKDIVV
jgi:predicted RNase H-like HicB family nuclease